MCIECFLINITQSVIKIEVKQSPLSTTNKTTYVEMFVLGSINMQVCNKNNNNS